MKKIFIMFALMLCLFLPPIFTGCDFGASGGAIVNNSTDLVVVEEGTSGEGETPSTPTQYKSKKLSLVTEINGSFNVNHTFILDPTDENKRLYDDLYFYQDDYFYMDVADSWKIYCDLSDENDLEYVEVEKESGVDIQINVKKDGIYKLVFDIITHAFDLEYKSAITTPVFETIKNCDFYTLATGFVQMSQNPDNEDEFYVNNVLLTKDKSLSFYSHIHTSNYKVLLDQSVANQYAYIHKERSTFITIMIGGSYNIYINAKTYIVRLELTNKITADYYAQYVVYNKDTHKSDWIQLQPTDASTPYIFSFQLTVDRFTDIPTIYDNGIREYNLTLLDANNTTKFGKFTRSEYYYFNTAGTYNITVNLDTFTISAEFVPE